MTNDELKERVELLKEVEQLEGSIGAMSNSDLEDRIKLLKEVAELEEA